MDYPGGPPRHMFVFFIQSIMVKIFVLSQIEILAIFLSIFVSSFWYRFDICVGATTARDEYGCSPGRLREGTSMAAFDLGAGRSPAIRLPQTRKNVGSFFPNSPLALQEKHSRLCCIFVSAFL